MTVYELSKVEKATMQTAGKQGRRSSFLPQICFSVWVVGTFLLTRVMTSRGEVICWSSGYMASNS